jgi:hypothetical protein
VDDALLRPEPPQLAVGGEESVDRAHVRGHRRHVQADQKLRLVHRGRGDDVVASTDGEGQPVTRERHAHAVDTVGVQDDVRRRVVAVLVHGVGPVGGQ